MISNIGFFVMLIAGISTVWKLLWLLMTWSNITGATLSKKVGTDKENTNVNIEVRKSFSKRLVKEVVPIAVVTLAGILLYIFGFKFEDLLAFLVR